MSMFKPDTISNVFRRTALERKNNAALKIMRNKKIYEWTWTQYYRDCISFAKSLAKIGVE